MRDMQIYCMNHPISSGILSKRVTPCAYFTLSDTAAGSNGPAEVGLFVTLRGKTGLHYPKSLSRQTIALRGNKSLASF